MKNKISSLAGVLALLVVFLGGIKWEQHQRTEILMERWNNLWGWSEEERKDFFKMTQGLELRPKDYIQFVESIAGFNEAVAQMMANDDAVATVHCLHILNLVSEEKYVYIHDFCVKRIAAYYSRDEKGLPPSILEGRKSVITRIEDEAPKHPKLLAAISDN